MSVNQWGAVNQWSAAQAPLPTVNAGADTTSTDGETITLSGASASDYDTLQWSCLSGQSPTFSDATALNPTVTFNESGTHTLQLTATNAQGSVSDSLDVSVAQAPDTTKPVITLLGSASVTVVEGDTYNDAGATANDDVDGDITANIVTVNPVDVNTVGSYTVTYNVTDSSGNAADEVTRTVNVEAEPDTTKPVITLLGSPTVTITEGNAYTDAGATANDDVDGDITANIVTVNPVDVNTVGSYTVTYNVTDSSGNAADEVTRMVNVASSAGFEAKAGSDKVVLGGEIVTLSAAASTTPEGTEIVSYRWRQILGDSVNLAGSKFIECEFFAPKENYTQKLTFELTIFNNIGAIASDTVNVTVVKEGGTSAEIGELYRHGVYVFEVPTTEN